MPRRTRAAKRMLKEQDTVGALRETRKEMQELSGKKKAGTGAEGGEKRFDGQERHAAESTQPRHIARPGKPLKRR